MVNKRRIELAKARRGLLNTRRARMQLRRVFGVLSGEMTPVNPPL